MNTKKANAVRHRAALLAMLVIIKLPLTNRKVSAMPPDKAPQYNVCCGALWYTFGLTDFAVNLTYWEVSINLVFSTCLIFKFSFVFPRSFCCMVLLAAKGLLAYIVFYFYQ